MTRYFVAVFFLAISVAFLGCANVEPPVQTHAPTVADPADSVSEPNDASVRPPARSVAETGADARADATPAGTESVAETETAMEPGPDAGAGLKPARTASDANDPARAEPNGIVVEPPARAEVVVPAAREPNAVASPAAAEPNSPSFFDQYAAILATYVREDGLVNYGELRRRRLELKPALAALDELDPNVYRGWPQREKLAFWIDAYNLKMLDIIARNYPIESSWWLRLTWPPSDIRHIKGIWTDYRFLVMDEEFTPAEVEQRFFRKTFDDPRLWLALTYASQSGPPLAVRPYRGEDLDRRLDEQVKRFLASPQGLQIDRRNRVVRLSALFKPNWRGKEFVGRYGTDKKFKAHDPETRAVLNFLTTCLPREDVEFLEVENYTLEYLNFDWRLNDTARGY